MDFLGMGPFELLVIFIIVLIVFGPGKLPEVAGQIGKAVREVRKATSEMSRQLTEEIEAGKKGLEEVKTELKTAASPVSEAAREVSGQLKGQAEAGKKGLEQVRTELASAASPGPDVRKLPGPEPEGREKQTQ